MSRASGRDNAQHVSGYGADPAKSVSIGQRAAYQLLDEPGDRLPAHCSGAR